MYYHNNIKLLGEEKCIVYSNMFINKRIYKCSYGKIQLEVDCLCPDYLKDISIVPDFFKNLLDEVF